MTIHIAKFGSVLTSRQAGKEAYAAFLPTLTSLKDTEEIHVDFQDVSTFSPSWGDEFLTPLQKKFGDLVTLKNVSNPSVSSDDHDVGKEQRHEVQRSFCMKIDKAFLAGFFEKNQNSSAFGSPVKTVERLVQLLPPGTVLDLGAGDGRNALYLAEKGFQVHAVDVSEAGIEKLSRLAKERGLTIQTEVADALDYSINSDYDAIVVVLLFQFLDEAASIRLMNEIKTHTKEGGINVIHVFTKTGDRARLDQEEDPTAFYPNDGFLQEFYADWEIIEYASSSGPLIEKFHEDGTPMTSVVETIVAKKR